MKSINVSFFNQVLVLFFFLLASCGSNQRLISPVQSNSDSQIVIIESKDSISKSDPLNYTYLIENEIVKLEKGSSEVEIVQGSMAKKQTSYVGFDAFGDMNADLKEDHAVILKQSSGGSGQFYYVSVILSDTIENQLSSAFFIGDRISIVYTEIVNGQLNVRYLDREEQDPMSTQPSINKMKQLKLVNGKLFETHLIAPITFKEWKWLQTSMKNGEIITPSKLSSYTIVFNSNGNFVGKTDCNRIFGSFKLLGVQLNLSDIGSTKMYCENSLESFYLQSLAEVESYTITNDDKLLLQLKAGAGILLFE